MQVVEKNAKKRKKEKKRKKKLYKCIVICSVMNSFTLRVRKVDACLAWFVSAVILNFYYDGALATCYGTLHALFILAEFLALV